MCLFIARAQFPRARALLGGGGAVRGQGIVGSGAVPKCCCQGGYAGSCQHVSLEKLRHGLKGEYDDGFYFSKSRVYLTTYPDIAADGISGSSSL